MAYIVVPSSSEVLGLLSSALHGHPSRQLTVVGVTGTNGKTTIATLLFRLFRALGYRIDEEHCHLHGLADFAPLRQIWLDHLMAAEREQ